MREAALSSPSRSPARRARDERCASDARRGEARRRPQTALRRRGSHPRGSDVVSAPVPPDRRRGGPATRGVRAGQVGAKLPREQSRAEERWNGFTAASAPGQLSPGWSLAGDGRRPTPNEDRELAPRARKRVLARSGVDARKLFCLQKSMGGVRPSHTPERKLRTGWPSLSPRGRGEEGAGSRLEAAMPTSTVAGVLCGESHAGRTQSMEGALDRGSRRR